MKVLVIGSGPIVIGQAAEFDYAGTQACKALREEGHQVVLINSNPATIMTDPGVSDALYIEPLTLDFCTRVIVRERPDALLPTLGGQTGLNLATQLNDAGVLDEYNVKVLGTPLSAIRKAEDREQFRDLMREIKEPVPESWIIETPAQLEEVLDLVPYPCIIRPAYTLGGTGGGVAHSRKELSEIGGRGLKLSMRSQIMVERSLLGWKEIEYEVMRDSMGNTITVCNMENLDPMGVHTGDSIVVAPSQTLSDIEYHMMRTASLKIINALGIEGGCNVQMALNPDGFDYYIIEVNPRVSRSSALASKATGYPIARVAAKIAVGRTLDEIDNQVTGTTKACFEPALDYCVVKIPRWPFDKFGSADRSLFTQMKATGEVMAIDRSFEAALMKAIRGLEVRQKDLRHSKYEGGTGVSPVNIQSHGRDGHDTHGRDAHATANATSDAELADAVKNPTDERLWALAEALRRGWTIEEVNRLSRVDPWFLRKIDKLVKIELRLVAARNDAAVIPGAVQDAFESGFSSTSIQQLLEVSDSELRTARKLLRNHAVVNSNTDRYAAVVALRNSLLSAMSSPRSDIPELTVDEVRSQATALTTKLAERIDTIADSNPSLTAALAIERLKVQPVFKMVDTCAGEFESKTPYYYGTFDQEDDALH